MSERYTPESKGWLTRRKAIALAATGALGVAAFFVAYRVDSSTPERRDVNGTAYISPEQMQHMPGATIDGDALRITATNFALVEQDASATQPNPPINVAGTHWEAQGDFAIGATMEHTAASTASLQLYGTLPHIADEFRVERESVRLTMAGDRLTAQIWDGGGQEPVETQAFPIAQQESNNLQVVRRGEQLQFKVNGVTVGEMAEHDVFDSGQIWFGADGAGSDWWLKNVLAAELPGGTLREINPSREERAGQNEKGLQYYAAQKRPDFTVGYAGASIPLMADEAYAKAMLNPENFLGMTTENALKMQFTQPQPGVYAFQEADALVQLARRNGQSVHGHTLVFAEANPQWFNALPAQTQEDKLRIETIMLDRVTTLVQHYRADINSWDVINEPLADYDNFDTAQPLREHKWFAAMGEDYIVKAMSAAHAANPDARLFMNEYGLEADGERWDAFVQLLERLAPKLHAAGVPLSAIGVGFQAHVYEQGDKIDAATLRRHIQQLAAMGVVSQVSEMDVYSDDGDAVQAEQYASVFDACLQEPGCIAWRAWIASDKYNYWMDDDKQIQQGVDGLYDTSVQPRPAYNGLLQVAR